MIETAMTPTGPYPPETPRRSALFAPLRTPSELLGSSASWRGLAYLICSLAIGWVLFLLYVVIVLLPLAPVWSYYTAKLERWRVTLMQAAPIADPHPPLDGSVTARAGHRLGEAATWREVVYGLILAAFGPLISLGVMVYGALVGGLILAPWLAETEQYNVFGWTIDNQLSALALCAVGIALGAVGVYVAYAVSAVNVALAQALLSPREEELRRLVARLQASRGVLVNSFEGERRRIERDLHDGPQQDLVSLSMQLGMLQQSVEDEAVRGEVAQAQARLERAMAGLRDTVRGVHPQVLDDAGVEAACAELGGPLRVEVIAGEGWPQGRRLPTEVERAMYYTASEAVTNAIKHGGATAVRIVFTGEPPAMTVTDDGSGGADVAAGTGLAGLVERAESMGATLTVLSPVGGPTTLHWSLP
ncbi:sensor histidine kinase [Tsukamurella strandjordii]|uniref:sensor histidine kinase n=1 Tax=Tsukamurella strandjordii TaxID=147577 RepID=UPI0031D58B66